MVNSKKATKLDCILNANKIIKKYKDKYDCNIIKKKIIGSKGDDYTVTIIKHTDEIKTCTCLGYYYRNTCRHIKE
jgi:hypothetical protein